jgi:hypothetical protein
MALSLVAKLTSERRARAAQLIIEYDPRPPFGGIDWDRDGPLPRALRAGVTLVAPLLTLRPRRLTKQAGWR